MDDDMDDDLMVTRLFSSYSPRDHDTAKQICARGKRKAAVISNQSTT